MSLSVVHNPDEWLWKDLVGRNRSVIYDTWPWQQCLERRFGNIRVRRFAVVENGVPTGGVTLFQTESFLTGKRLTTDPFHLTGSTFVETETQMEALVRAVSAWAEQAGIDSVEWTLASNRFRSIFERFGFYGDPYYFHPTLSLGNSYDEIFRGYKKQFRINLGNTHKRLDSDAAIRFHTTASRQTLENVHRLLLSETKKRYCNLVPPLSFFSDLRTRFEPGGQFRIYTVCRHGKIIAADLILIHNDTAHYGWSAVDSRFRDLSLASYLLDRIIRSFYDTDSKIRYLDLGPVSPLSEGLYFFKSRWGADFKRPHRFRRNISGKPIRQLDASEKMGTARKSIRYIPDILFRVIVNKCYKYLV
jgi:GNAT acetyltransferase-like protein